VPGSYYLTYFGHAQPPGWEFKLYKNGIAEGQKYSVEVIDTWAMTITRVAGEFVTRKLDNYHYIDASGRNVPLPGKPGIALRILRLGADGQPVKTELPVD